MEKTAHKFAEKSAQGYQIIARGGRNGRNALLFRGLNSHQPYVVAHGYDETSGTWSHGTYLSSLADAVEELNA